MPLFLIRVNDRHVPGRDCDLVWLSLFTTWDHSAAAMLRSVGSHADSHVDTVQWSRLREQSPALERVCGNGGDPREGQVCRAPCWKQAEGSEQILALPNNPPPGFPDTVITL